MGCIFVSSKAPRPLVSRKMSELEKQAVENLKTKQNRDNKYETLRGLKSLHVQRACLSGKTNYFGKKKTLDSKSF